MHAHVRMRTYECAPMHVHLCSSSHTLLPDIHTPAGHQDSDPELELECPSPKHRSTLIIALAITRRAGQVEKLTSQKGNSLFLLRMMVDAVQLRAQETLLATAAPADEVAAQDDAARARALAPAGMEREIQNVLDHALNRGRLDSTATRETGSFTKGPRKGSVPQEKAHSYLLSFYRIPAVSFVMRFLAHLVNLTLCALQIQFAVGEASLFVTSLESHLPSLCLS